MKAFKRNCNHFMTKYTGCAVTFHQIIF